MKIAKLQDGKNWIMVTVDSAEIGMEFTHVAVGRKCECGGEMVIPCGKEENPRDLIGYTNSNIVFCCECGGHERPTDAELNNEF